MSWTTTSPYEIGRFTGNCAATGAPLKPGDPAVAALAERDGDEGYERFDYSQAAWLAGARPARLFAFWRWTIPAGDARPKLVDSESLLALFEQMDGADDPRRIAFRYVLALVLIRNRTLIYAGQRRAAGLSGTSGGGGTSGGALLVRRKGDDESTPPVEVADPALDEQSIADVTEQIRGIFNDAGGSR